MECQESKPDWMYARQVVLSLQLQDVFFLSCEKIKRFGVHKSSALLFTQGRDDGTVDGYNGISGPFIYSTLYEHTLYAIYSVYTWQPHVWGLGKTMRQQYLAFK